MILDQINENPRYVLIGETARRRYYIHCSGKVLSISKSNCSYRKWIRERNNRGIKSVRIGNKDLSVLNLLVEGFYSFYLRSYGPNYRVIFINGNREDINIRNICVQIGEFTNVQSNC
jgi:hypothetical protein